MANELLLAELLALGVITHQLVYFAQCGVGHFVDDFMPLIGFHLGPWPRAAASVALSLACLTLIYFPFDFWPRVALTAFLVVEIIFFPCRLPNHLVIALSAAALLLVAFVVRDQAGFYYGLASLVCAVYAATGVHKLNRNYLHPKRSCGSLLALLWCKEKRIALLPVVVVLSLLSIYGVVATELYLSCSLVTSVSAFQITVAILIHIAFGLLCHVHFSVIMFSLLVPFVDVPSAIPALSASAGVALGGGAICGVMLGGYSPFRHPWFMFGLYAVFGAGCVAVLYSVCTYGVVAAPSESRFRPSGITVWYFVPTVLLIVSAVGPYTGWKTEFSLAMFSNLRPDVSNHCFLPQSRAKSRAVYVTFDLISGYVYLAHCPSWRHAWVVRQLQDWQRNKYSPYFITEALRLIETETGEIGSMRFSGVVGEERFTECSANQLRRILSRHPNRALFPAVLYQDTSLPYMG